MVGRGKRHDVADGQLSFDALLWGPAPDAGEEREGDERDQHQPSAAEPVRADGAAALGEVAAERAEPDPGPEEIFSRLGLEAEAQIDQLAADPAGDDPGGEGYLEKVGRLRMARATAESQVLREMIPLPAEPGHPEYDAEQEQADEPSMYPAEAPWLPVVMTEEHPNYHDLDDDPGLRKTYLQDRAAPTE